MNSIADENRPKFVHHIIRYCEIYNIPRDNLIDILGDQKVLPMIRGKAMEFAGAEILRQVLDHRDWNIEKLNLNPQPGRYDEDISITSRHTGVRFKAETKSAVRGSFRPRTRNLSSPHFRVKCHRSRSNMTKVTNDRYLSGDFDILLSNVSNAIFRDGFKPRELPLIDDGAAISYLCGFYGVDVEDPDAEAKLRQSSYEDWRFCLPETIANEDGTIPRTPQILMEDDPNWFHLDQLAEKLGELRDRS